MAIDVGKSRIGLAVCDREAILSSPLEAVSRLSSLAETVSSLVNLAVDHEVFEVYVGEPISLSGADTESTTDARLLASELAGSLSVPVRMVDERLTTVTAASKLRAAGLNAKSSKSIIDSASAVEILELALDFERNSGMVPGSLVGDSVGS
jgi:putative Holliday junction resolvase